MQLESRLTTACSISAISAICSERSQRNCEIAVQALLMRKCCRWAILTNKGMWNSKRSSVLCWASASTQSWYFVEHFGHAPPANYCGNQNFQMKTKLNIMTERPPHRQCRSQSLAVGKGHRVSLPSLLRCFGSPVPKSEFLALKQLSTILGHSSNPVCGFSMMEQVRLCAV